MYKIIKSRYIFTNKDPLTERFSIHTTYKLYKILQYMALDNDMSISDIVNNAIAQYYINNIKKVRGPH